MCALDFALIQYKNNGVIKERECRKLSTELLKINPYKIQDFHSWIDRAYEKFWN
jgi:hypothetical protein